MAAKTKTKPKRPARVSTRNINPKQFGTQVDAETKLKFGPQDQSLRSALSDAATTRDQAVAGARGVRTAIQGAAAAAQPQIEANYGSAQRAVDQVSTSLAASLAGAGALGGAAARDAAGTKERLSEALANAKTEATSRSRDAVSGEAFARQNAGAQYQTAAKKIRAQQQEVASEKGAFAQARSGELVSDQASRDVTQRGQDVTADTAAAGQSAEDSRAGNSLAEQTRHNKATEAAAQKKARKHTLAAPANVEKARTAVNRALDAARSVAGEVTAAEKAKGTKLRDRAATAKILVSGRAGQSIKNDPKSGEPLANPIKIPGVKQQDQLYASVALDMLYDGRLSQKNQTRLRALGLTPKMLGLTAAYSQGHPDVTTAPAGRVGRGQQQRPT